MTTLASKKYIVTFHCQFMLHRCCHGDMLHSLQSVLITTPMLWNMKKSKCSEGWTKIHFSLKSRQQESTCDKLLIASHLPLLCLQGENFDQKGFSSDKYGTMFSL